MGKPLHVHFGPGNIGLGLVVPCLEGDCRLIVSHIFTDRADACKWPDSISPNIPVKLRLSVPGRSEETRWVTMLLPESGGFNEREVERALADPEVDLLMLGVKETEASHLLPVLSEAASFSTAMGPGQNTIAKILKSAPGPGGRPILLFENQASEDLLQLPGFRAIPLVIDRLCTDRHVDRSGWSVKCEDKPQHQVIGPDVPELVSFTSVERVRKDLMVHVHRRKRALVNDVHQFVAILAYDYLREAEIESGRWDKQSLKILIDAILSPSPGVGKQYKVILGILIAAEAMMVTLQTDSDTRLELFGSPRERDVFEVLKAEGWASLRRFQRFANDLIGRILTFENRDRLLTSTEKYLEVFGKNVVSKQRRLMAFRAGNAPPVEHIFRAIMFMKRAVLKAIAYSYSAKG